MKYLMKWIPVCLLACLLSLPSGCKKFSRGFKEAQSIQKLLKKRFPTLRSTNVRIKHTFGQGKQLQISCLAKMLPAYKGRGFGSRAKYVSAYLMQHYPSAKRPKMVTFVVHKKKKNAKKRSMFGRHPRRLFQIYRFRPRILMAFKLSKVAKVAKDPKVSKAIGSPALRKISKVAKAPKVLKVAKTPKAAQQKEAIKQVPASRPSQSPKK